jgi:hypothetical protein
MPNYPNSVTRTLNEKLGETPSVLDFGAVGDGVTDDRAAIQLALDAIALRGGGSLLFPPGRYYVGSYHPSGGTGSHRYSLDYQTPTEGAVALRLYGDGATITTDLENDDGDDKLLAILRVGTLISSLAIEGLKFESTHVRCLDLRQRVSSRCNGGVHHHSALRVPQLRPRVEPWRLPHGAHRRERVSIHAGARQWHHAQRISICGCLVRP